MNFLQPLLSAALALMAVPFILHLFTRRKFTDVPFTSLIFLKQSQRRSLRRLTLHNLLVLLCRALAVGLLALAFMMPAFKGRQFQFLGGRTRVALAVVMDNSYSMNWEHSGVSLFDRARAAALETLAGAAADDELFVIATCGPLAAQPLTTHKQTRNAMVESVRNLAPGACASDVTSAINRATFELERSGVPDRRVLVLTDMQKHALRGRVRRPGPGAPEIRFADLGVDQAAGANLGIASVDLPVYPLAGDAVPLCFTVRGGQEKARPVVTLTINGKPRGEQAVILSRTRNRSVSGQGCFRPTFSEPGTYAAELALQGDSLKEDNLYRFVFDVNRQMRVILAADPDAASDPGADAYYIARAFSAARGAGTGSSPLRLDTVLPENLAAQNFKDVRAVVIPSRTPVSRKAAGRLRDFALEGGGLLLFSDGTAIPGDVTDKLFFSGGTVLSAADILGNGGAAKHSFVSLSALDSGHVLFRDFSGDMAAQIADTRFLAPGRLVVNAADVHVLATLTNGDPVMVERALGRGRVALLASGVNPYVSNMALKTYFVPLLFKMVKYLGRQHSGGERRFVSGEPVVLDFAAAPGAPELTASLRDRAGKTLTLALEPGSSGARFRAAASPDPGIYSVTVPGQGAVLEMFAVNADPSEGNLNRASRAALNKAYARYNHSVTDASRFFPSARMNRWAFSKEFSYLWIPLALAAMFFMALDTLVSNRR